MRLNTKIRERSRVKYVITKPKEAGGTYSIPVLLKRALGNRRRLELVKSPLVDDVGIAGVVEETGGYPRLRNNHC